MFENLADSQAMQAFMGYFEIRAAVDTVGSKASHLKRFADSAEKYFSGRDEFKCGRVAVVADYMGSLTATFKREEKESIAMK